MPFEKQHYEKIDNNFSKRTQCAPRRRKLCCTGDEGRPLEVAMQVEASNRLKLLWSKAMVVSVKEKVLLERIR